MAQVKLVKSPLHKVQQAYFNLKYECRSSIFDHNLIRDVLHIYMDTADSTFIIIPEPKYNENLLMYLKNKRRRLCEQEVLSLFHQICEFVQICHKNGIITRDLKLSRFYFIDEEKTKLQYDSLECCVILDNPSCDVLDYKIGCLRYAAPELFTVNSTYRGKSADMWTLGVILYTMLAGRYPFNAIGDVNLIRIIRYHNKLVIPDKISNSARWLLLALLNKNYKERLRSEHVLLSPWLRQLKPAYMYIPVDVEIE